MYTYILILCFAIFLFVQQNNKKHEGLNYVLLLVEAIFLIFSVNNSDYSNYLLIYNGEMGSEIGIRFVSSILRGIGLESYTYFLVLVMALIEFVFWKWGKLIPYINHVLFLYALMIMYYDCIQIRNTIATFLILYGLYLSLYDKKVEMIIVCIIAVLFHSFSALFALMLLYVVFVRQKDNYEISKFEIGLHAFGGIFIILFGRKILLFLAAQGPFFHRIYGYLSADNGYDSLIIWAGSTVFLMVLLWYFGVRNVLSVDNLSVPEINKKAVNYLYRYTLFSVSCSGFLLFLNEFNRTYRLFNMMLFMVFALVEDEMSWKNKRILFVLFTLINIAFMMVALSRGVDLDTFFVKW